MKKILLLLVAVVVVLGGTVYLVSTGGRSSSAEDIIIDMQVAMAGLDSVKFKGTLEVEGKTGQEIPGTASLAPFMGEDSGAENKITEGTVTINFDGAFNEFKSTEKQGEVGLNVGFDTGKGPGEVGLRVRMIGEEGKYVQLSMLELPESEDIATLDLIGQQLVDEWIEIKPKPEEEAIENEEVNEKKVGEYKKLLKKAKLLDVLEQGSDQLEGVSASLIKISAQPNIDNIRDFALQVYEYEHDGTQMPFEDQDEMNAWLYSIKDLTGTIWVGEKDDLLYRVEITGPFVYLDDSSGTLDLAFDLYDHDKPAKITAPEKVLTQEELTAKIMGAMFSGAMIPSM